MKPEHIKRHGYKKPSVNYHLKLNKTNWFHSAFATNMLTSLHHVTLHHSTLLPRAFGASNRVLWGRHSLLHWRPRKSSCSPSFPGRSSWISPFSAVLHAYAALLVPNKRGNIFPCRALFFLLLPTSAVGRLFPGTPLLLLCISTSASSSPPPLFDRESLFCCSSFPLSQIPSMCFPYLGPRFQPSTPPSLCACSLQLPPWFPPLFLITFQNTVHSLHTLVLFL